MSSIIKKDNKGLSLVELLAAIAIGAIISGSIATLLVISMRMYNHDITDVAVQQELQMTLNQIMDYAMESETVVMDDTGSGKDFVAFGQVAPAATEGDDPTLNAQIFWLDEGEHKLYMVKDSVAKYNTSAVAAKIPTSGLEKYLLAEYVDSFSAKVNGLDSMTSTYENPISVDINLQFSKTTTGKVVNKKVSDTAVLRNRVKEAVYIGDTKYVKKADSVYNIVTESVPMQKNAGDIKIEGIPPSMAKGDLRILEIVPEYCYDYVQFALGGPGGAIMNDVNIDYGSEASITPITSAEMEGYLFYTAGQDYNVGDNASNYFPNHGASIRAMETFFNEPCTGYYEYVGRENGGIYAINSYEERLEVAPSGAGYGDVKPNILGFLPERGWYGEDKLTPKCYNPIFKYISNDDGSGDYYKATVSSSSGGDYDKKEERIHHDNGWDETIIYYEYAGKGKGQYDVRFEKPNYSGNSGYNHYDNLCYKLADDKDSYFTAEGGSYYAYIDGWNPRTSTKSYEKGYDFTKKVLSVVMYSPYYGTTPAKSTDYGWIWRNAEPGTDLYNDISSGRLISSSAVLDTGAYSSSDASESQKRIYLKDHKRCYAINNEVFKLFTMQDALEQYTTNVAHMLDIKCGIWDEAAGTYNEINYPALKAWEQAGHKITLSVRKPSEVTVDDINNIDMIIVAEPTDGAFGYTKTWVNAIKGTSLSGDYSMTNDLKFPVVVAIYKKVINEEISIVCPSRMASYGNGTNYNNMSKLFTMLYCVANKDIAEADIIKSTYKDAKETKKKEQERLAGRSYWSLDTSYQSEIESSIMTNGSGRDLFSDYLLSMSDDCLSSSLYKNGTLQAKTTGIVYIDESNGSIVANSINGKIDGMTMKYDGFTRSSWGDGSGAFETGFFLVDKSEYLTKRYAYKDGKTNYVANSSYGHEYKFYYGKPAREGVYRNMALYNNSSPILTYKSGGATGIVLLAAAKGNAHYYSSAELERKIGTIEVVGAGKRIPGDNSQTFERSGVRYQIRPETTIKGGDRVIIYLTPAELAECSKPDWEGGGLDIYCLVKTSEEITYDESDINAGQQQNKNALWYAYNDTVKADEARSDNDKVGLNLWYSSNRLSEAVRYQGGGIANYDAVVQEFKYHIHGMFFDNYYDPDNDVNRNVDRTVNNIKNLPNNKLEARIKATSVADGTEYYGSAELVIIVRDVFDLD